jgi:hypothetical protein
MAIEPGTSARITLLRFPLILGIIIIHAYGSNVILSGKVVGISQFTGTGFLIQYYLSSIIAAACVPCFAFISGFLFFNSFDGSINKYCGKLTSRIKRLLIPYLLWNLSMLSVLAILQANSLTAAYFSGQFPPISSYSIYGFLNAIFGFDQSPIIVQFWFIRDLMILMLLSPILYWIIRHIPYVGLAVLLGFLLFCVDKGDVRHVISIRVTFFFFTGGEVACKTASLDGWDKYGKIFLILYMLLSIIELFHIGAFYYNFIHGINMILGVYLLIWLAGIINKKDNLIRNALIVLAPSSFFIYAIHAHLEMIVRKFSYIIIKPSNYTVVTLIYFFIIFITTIACISLYFLIKKLYPSLIYVMCGGR